MPTKYYSNNKPNPYADIPISITAFNEDDEDEEVICDQCQVINYQTRGAEYEYHCKHCGHTLNVKQEVEIANIVESESMDDNPEPLVSYGEDPDARFYKDKKPEYQGAFKALQDRGIHITSYTERSGDGRITSSWNDGSNSSAGSDRKMSAPRPMRFTEDRNSEDSDSE